MSRAKKVVSKRSATSADVSLGEKIRTRRIAEKMSQADLGDHLNISFQQIQKYEKGTNRVGAARLEQIAKALGEDVSYFIGGGAVSKVGLEMQELMSDKINLRMCRALAAMKDLSLKYQFVRIAESVSGIASEDA